MIRNKKIISILLIFMILAPISVLSKQVDFEKQKNETNTNIENEITITIYKINGVEKIKTKISNEHLSKLKTNPLDIDLIEILPKNTKEYVNKILDEEYTKLKNMKIFEVIDKKPIFSHFIKQAGLKKHMSLSEAKELLLERTDEDRYYYNALSYVKGVGLLLLFPPYIPITPVLFAGLLIMNTRGVMGSWNETLDKAFMIPFVGLSVWASGAYVFAGFSGFTIGIKEGD